MDLNFNNTIHKAYINFLVKDFQIYNPFIIAIRQNGIGTEWIVLFDYKHHNFQLSYNIDYLYKNLYVIAEYENNKEINRLCSKNKSDITNFINKITMNTYQKALVEEHAQLAARTQNLHDYIYSEASQNDDKVEFANKCIQLRAMKNYEDALRARLENADVVFENGQYFEKVASIQKVIVPPANEGQGSDFDADGEDTPQGE